jgi:hypothetical protein
MYSTDSVACDNIKREVLQTTKLVGTTKDYCGDVAKAWSCVYEALVHFLTMKETLPTWTSIQDCPTTFRIPMNLT